MRDIGDIIRDITRIEVILLEHEKKMEWLEKIFEKEVFQINGRIDTEIQSAIESRRLIHQKIEGINSKLDSYKNWLIGILLAIVGAIFSQLLMEFLRSIRS